MRNRFSFSLVPKTLTYDQISISKLAISCRWPNAIVYGNFCAFFNNSFFNCNFSSRRRAEISCMFFDLSLKAEYQKKFKKFLKSLNFFDARLWVANQNTYNLFSATSRTKVTVEKQIDRKKAQKVPIYFCLWSLTAYRKLTDRNLVVCQCFWYQTEAKAIMHCFKRLSKKFSKLRISGCRVLETGRKNAPIFKRCQKLERRLLHHFRFCFEQMFLW